MDNNTSRTRSPNEKVWLMGFVLLCTITSSSAWANDCSDGKLRAGIVANQTLLSQEPDSRIAKLGLASCYLYQNKINKASPYIKQLIESNPGDVDALLLQGEVYKRQKHMERAAESFQNAARLDPSREKAFLELSNILMSLGKKDQSDAAFIRYRELSNVDL